MPAHVGAGVPVNRDTHRGLSPRGYDSHRGECYVDEPLALITPTQKYYYHANHLYSVAALTNNVGAVVERYRYDAYGQRIVLAADGTTARAASNYGNQVAYTGRYLDQETGLYYFRARYYSGSLGRFIGRDPLGYVDGFGLYKPYFIPNAVDPSGAEWEYAGMSDVELIENGETNGIIFTSFKPIKVKCVRCDKTKDTGYGCYKQVLERYKFKTRVNIAKKNKFGPLFGEARKGTIAHEQVHVDNRKEIHDDFEPKVKEYFNEECKFDDILECIVDRDIAVELFEAAIQVQIDNDSRHSGPGWTK